jgi:hypothetical protein
VVDRWLVMGLMAVNVSAVWAFRQDVGGRHPGAVLGRVKEDQCSGKRRG